MRTGTRSLACAAAAVAVGLVGCTLVQSDPVALAAKPVETCAATGRGRDRRAPRAPPPPRPHPHRRAPRRRLRSAGFAPTPTSRPRARTPGSRTAVSMCTTTCGTRPSTPAPPAPCRSACIARGTRPPSLQRLRHGGGQDLPERAPQPGRAHDPLLRRAGQHLRAHQPGQRRIYNVAYDFWINGIPNEEVMIWTDNYRQVPPAAGSPPSPLGVSWDVYATPDNHYIAFVPSGGARLTSGA